MLVSVLPVPFGDAGRQRQYEAVLAALAADADAPATVLLGNLGAFSPVQADMLVVRLSGLALGVLTPQAGQLTIPALAYGPWLLDGQPLPAQERADNPFAQYQQQVPIALGWLSEHFGLPENELPPCLGLALFDASLTFGSGVEAQLHQHAAAHDFQLVGGAGQLPGRLHQPLDAEAGVLTEDELLAWGYFLTNEPYVAHEQGEPQSPLEGLPAYLAQKLRQLWRWLGAEDIPADPPYGGAPPADQHLRDQQEQARLQQLRQELQAELHQQRQEAATREALRTQELTLLRQQLTQAGPSATERAAEQRAKDALEESLRTARAELTARNHELDIRIQQLGQLIGQLQAAPAAAPPTAPVLAGRPAGSRPAGPAAVPLATPATAQKPRPAAAPRRSFRRLRQAERWGVVALVLAGAGAGTWGVVRWAHHAPGARLPPSFNELRPTKRLMKVSRPTKATLPIAWPMPRRQPRTRPTPLLPSPTRLLPNQSSLPNQPCCTSTAPRLSTRAARLRWVPTRRPAPAPIPDFCVQRENLFLSLLPYG